MKTSIQTADCPLPTAHCRLPTVDCRLPTAYCLLIILSIVSAGCQMFGRSPKNSPAAAQTAGEVERFFAYWNQNARRIDSVQCDHIDIDGKSQGQIYPMITARLAYQQPNNFRLTGKALGKTEIDLGSNTEEIWFWIARSNPPAVYFCNRRDLPSVESVLPVNPDWIGEILGVNPLDPRAYRQGESTPEYLTLVSQVDKPGGRTLYKRLVVHRQTNRIAAFELFDDTGKRLAEVNVVEYFDDRNSGQFMPRRLSMKFPESQSWLTFSMVERHIHFNSVTPELAQSVFRRGEYLDTQVVDLGAQIHGRSPPGPVSPHDPLLWHGHSQFDPQVRRAGAAPVELLGEIITDR